MMISQQNPQNKENIDYLNMPNILKEPQNSTRHNGGKSDRENTQPNSSIGFQSLSSAVN